MAMEQNPGPLDGTTHTRCDLYARNYRKLASLLTLIAEKVARRAGLRICEQPPYSLSFPCTLAKDSVKENVFSSDFPIPPSMIMIITAIISTSFYKSCC